MSREADRQQLPALMRRDVRLLGDLLGEVIRESGGQDLLDDVERLRRAVIAAREIPLPDGDTDAAGDEIAAMVGGWPLARAELVAKAFTIYFHLTNLAEERQRVRVLRGEAETGSGAADGEAEAGAGAADGEAEAGAGAADGEAEAGAGVAGGEADVNAGAARGEAGGVRVPRREPLRRESLAAAVAELGGQGAGRLDSLIAGLRVHPVLTAHPTEARRRAVATGLRRIAGLIEALDGSPAGAEQAGVLRRLREEIQLLWLAAQGQAHGADRRGSVGDGGVRRDALHPRPRGVPGARPGVPRCGRLGGRAGQGCAR